MQGEEQDKYLSMEKIQPKYNIIAQSRFKDC